jgi:tetratricopeptide (TPR) repeat protein
VRPLLVAGAFAVGALRAWALPAISDGTFQLLRVGDALLHGSLAGHASPPGGDGAPILGALVAALGVGLEGGAAMPRPEGFSSLTRLPASLLLGATAAALAAILVRKSRVVAVFGVALLVLPPAFATSFVLRPDAALGGFLLTLALAGRSAPLAWTAVLTTPVALPAAALLTAGARRRGARATARAALAAGAVVLVLAALSLALPEGRRSQIAAGVFSGWTLSLDGLTGTADTLRRVWAGGALLAAPILLARWSRGPRELLVPWLATVLAATLLSAPGAFRESTAALVGPTALLLATQVAAWPDPRRRADGPHRPVLFAMLVPVLLLILGTDEDRSHRRRLREESARLAQIDAFLREGWPEAGAILSERTGTLAALSSREVLRLRRDGALPPPLAGAQSPRFVVFRDGLRPFTAAERRLFESPEFLRGFAPLELRRGATNAILDAIWVRRERPTEAPEAEYAIALREGWRAADRGDRDLARLRLDRAAELEPPGIGTAREALGLLLEQDGDETGSKRAFRGALSDPAAIRARGHLADRELTAGRVLAADTLVAQAFRFNAHLAEMWGTRARLFLHGGWFEEAKINSANAIRLNPYEAKILANHGSLLWAQGERFEAKQMWRRAVRADPRVLRFLGDFEEAPDDAPTPPLIPLYSLVGFGRTAPP